MRYAWVCFSLMEGNPPRRRIVEPLCLMVLGARGPIFERMINSFFLVQSVRRESNFDRG